METAPLFEKRDKKIVVVVFTPAEIDILTSIPNSSIVKGDAKFMSIAAVRIS
jgi:ribonuclease HII